MNIKKLEEIAKQKNKKLLIESFSLETIKKEDIEVFDKPLLVESSGETFKARGILRNVPVTKFTENYNERIYPKPLWEKIYITKAAEGTLSLADHPDDDGSIKNIAGVWRNFKLTESNGVADWYLVGDWGQLILETVQAGGKVGVSSVGFGEFMEDGKTVDPDSYELERLGDAVINPSQAVFATLENVQKPKADEINENLQENTNKDSVIVKITEETSKMSDKINLANYRNNVKLSIDTAKSKTKISEAVRLLSEIKSDIPEDMKDLHDKVDAAIAEKQEEMEGQIQNASEVIKAKDDEISDLEEKIKVADKAIAELKEKCKKATSMLEKVKDISIDDFNQLMENEKAMLEDIEKFKIERKKHLSEIRTLKEQKLTESKMSKLLKEYKEKAKKSEVKADKVYKHLKKAESHIKKLERILEEEYDYEFEEDEDKEEVVDNVEDTISDEDVENFEENDDITDEELLDVSDEDEVIEEDEEEDVVDVDIEDEASDEEITEEDESMDDDSVIDDIEDDEKFSEEDEEEVIDDETSEEDEEEIKLEAIRRKKLIARKKQIAEAKRKQALREKAKSKNSKINTNNKMKLRIKEYYEEAKESNPAIKDIRKEILNSRSLVEAVSKVEAFKNKRKSNNITIKKMNESMSSDWLGKRF